MSAFSDYLENDIIVGLLRSTVLTAWIVDTTYSLGDRVYASTGDGRIYECTVAGDSHATTEPTWNTTLGGTTTDSGVTWTTCEAGVPRKALWIALYTAAPSDTGGGTEVTGGAYVREQYDPSDTNWSAAGGGTDGKSSSLIEIAFTEASASWGEVTHLGILDKLTGGNLLWWGVLSTPKEVDIADTFKITAGDLSITFA